MVKIIEEAIEEIEGNKYILLDCSFCGYETMHQIQEETVQCNLCGLVRSTNMSCRSFEKVQTNNNNF